MTGLTRKEFRKMYPDVKEGDDKDIIGLFEFVDTHNREVIKSCKFTNVANAIYEVVK
jgi:hypothetical protein